jgi:hypothetical protein
MSPPRRWGEREVRAPKEPKRIARTARIRPRMAPDVKLMMAQTSERIDAML